MGAKVDKDCMFAITADYRPDNENKPVYYVLAANRRKAKTKFKDRIPQLTIYDCVRVRQEKRIEDIMGNPDRYIVIK